MNSPYNSCFCHYCHEKNHFILIEKGVCNNSEWIFGQNAQPPDPDIRLRNNGRAGNTKGGSVTVLLTSCLTGLESAVCRKMDRLWPNLQILELAGMACQGQTL
jgi:hypothetical protein